MNTTTPVYPEYNFIPNTTIQELVQNTDDYPTGTVTAVVTSTEQTTSNDYLLKIKDGEFEEDKGTVSYICLFRSSSHY